MATPENQKNILEELKQAIRSGNIQATKQLTKSSRSLTKVEISQAFLETIKTDNLPLFNYFVDDVDGLNLRYSDEKGRRALHYAVDVGNLIMVKTLMKYGAPLNFSDNEGYQAIHIATQNGNVEMLQFLVSHGANITSAKTLRDGYTPLHIAALTNQPRALEVLVDRVGTLNIQSKRHCDSLTPLHLAVKNCHVEIVKILCEKGACLDLADLEGRTPLHYAADRGNIDILNTLFNHGSSMKILDSGGRTVLHYGVYSKSAECVQLLIDKGCKVNSGDPAGNTFTPLLSAISVGSAEIVEILIRHGADVNVIQPIQETPLLIASSAGHVDIVKMLLMAGANVKAVNRKGETALHKCQKVAREKRDEIVQLLVDSGAELNVVDTNGFTPLHNCAFQTHMNNFSLSTLKILVEAGASLSAFESTSTVSNRHSPLCMLVWRGYLEAAHYLVESGWNMYSETWIVLPGKTPEQERCHQWMRDICRNPPPLLQLCRSVVRFHLITRCTHGCEIISRLSNLEIPRTLKDYLMLRDY